MGDVLLISLTGPDRPGITTRITGVLAGCGAQILDVAQSSIHDHLSLGMMVALPPERHGEAIKETLFAAHALGIQARFEPIDAGRYEAWVAGQEIGRAHV